MERKRTYPINCSCCSTPTFFKDKIIAHNHRRVMNRSTHTPSEKSKRPIDVTSSMVLCQTAALVEVGATPEQIRKKLKSIMSSDKMKGEFEKVRNCNFFIEKDSEITLGMNLYGIFFENL